MIECGVDTSGKVLRQTVMGWLLLVPRVGQGGGICSHFSRHLWRPLFGRKKMMTSLEYEYFHTCAPTWQDRLPQGVSRRSLPPIRWGLYAKSAGNLGSQMER